MQREADYLYERPVENDTEYPRECHILAMVATYKGEAIPDDVYNAVLGSAERGREKLKHVMDNINEFADRGFGKDFSEINKPVLAGTIALSYGIDGPKANDRKLRYLIQYFEGYLLTEELGPTE